MPPRSRGCFGSAVPSPSTRGHAGGVRGRAAPGAAGCSRDGELPCLEHPGSQLHPPGWVLGTEIVLELLNIHMFGMKTLAMLIRCLVPRAAESKALQGGSADPGTGAAEPEMQNPGKLSSQSLDKSFSPNTKPFLEGGQGDKTLSACEAAEGGCGKLFWRCGGANAAC